jgi:hypothetical protein
MAGVTVHGKQANIKWNGSVVASGLSWTCDITSDVGDVTSMQDTWRTFLPGFTDWTATVTALLPAAGAGIEYGETAAARLELYMLYAANDYRAIYGNAICTGAAPAVPKDGPATITYTFQGAAQLIYYDDTVVVP